jgi:hypothetical protein
LHPSLFYILLSQLVANVVIALMVVGFFIFY